MYLRELWIQYQGQLLSRWDHTSTITWAARTAMSKKKIKPMIFHPFRKEQKNAAARQQIKPANIGILAYAFTRVGDN